MSHRTELHHQHFSSSPVCFLQSDYKSWSWIIWKQLQTDPGYFMVNVLVCVSVMMKCTCNLAQGGLLWVFSHYVTVCVCVCFPAVRVGRDTNLSLHLLPSFHHLLSPLCSVTPSSLSPSPHSSRLQALAAVRLGSVISGITHLVDGCQHGNKHVQVNRKTLNLRPQWVCESRWVSTKESSVWFRPEKAETLWQWLSAVMNDRNIVIDAL